MRLVGLSDETKLRVSGPMGEAQGSALFDLVGELEHLLSWDCS